MMNAQIVALFKVVKDKEFAPARKGLVVGTHQVDCLVRIIGSIKVGEDSETDVRGTVNYRDAFATVCGMLIEKCKQSKSPLSDELIEDLISVAMRQGELAANVASEVMETIDAIERKCTKVTGTKPKKGTVTTKLDYRFEELAVADAA